MKPWILADINELKFDKKKDVYVVSKYLSTKHLITKGKKSNFAVEKPCRYLNQVIKVITTTLANSTN